MSKASWMSEFYPVDASAVSKAQALNHSIRKWMGLLPENLKRHRLSEPPFSVDADTCALCKIHWTQESCGECPLYLVRGRVRCDSETVADAPGWSPFDAYTERGNARPMLAWLLAAKHTL